MTDPADLDDDIALLNARRAAADVRNRLDTLTARRPDANPRRELTLASIGVGWRIFSAERMWNTDTDIALAEPVGGICVETSGRPDIDTETGEKFSRLQFRCLTVWRPWDPWQTIDGAEIDTDQLAGLDRSGSWAAIVWLLGRVHTRRRSPAPGDIGHIVDAWRLACAIA